MSENNIEETKTQLNNPGEGEEEETPEEGSVEVEGVKYKEDPDKPGEALKDDNDEPIPFEEAEEEEEGFVEVDGVKCKEDPENPGQALLDSNEQPIPFEEKKGTEGEQPFVMPDKFKGKKPEEIAKSYTELEKMIDKKAGEKALELLKEKGFIPKKEDKEEKDKFEDTFPMKDGKPDFAKFTVPQFASWVEQMIERKAEEKARRVYEESSKMRSTVRTEIAEVQKNHPLLKKDQDYTDLVLSILESAAAKGKEVTLEDACSKVDKFAGKKENLEKKDKEKLKKARLEVETATGAAPGGGEQTEGQKIREGLMKGSKSELGGLGI